MLVAMFKITALDHFDKWAVWFFWRIVIYNFYTASVQCTGLQSMMHQSQAVTVNIHENSMLKQRGSLYIVDKQFEKISQLRSLKLRTKIKKDIGLL